MTSLPPFDVHWAWFLDIDGTLLDIAAIPSAVKPAPADCRLVTELYAETHGALALISGRSLEGIDKLFHPLRLPAAGQHGIERRDARGEIHRHAFPEEGLRLAAREIRYRLAPQLAGAVHATVRRAAEHLGEGVEVQSGKMVAELKPSGRDKGIAIGEFMAELPFRGRTPVFLGDDLTDEQGFHVVNRLGGHAVKIGLGPSAARWRIPDAAAVRAWLRGGLERLVRAS